MRLQLNNFTQKLDFDCYGLGEEERTKIRKKNKEKKRKKKKKEKKEINLIAAKSGLAGMKGYLKTYNRVKYFLPYLSRF